jgi:hypothetical protein
MGEGKPLRPAQGKMLMDRSVNVEQPTGGLLAMTKSGQMIRCGDFKVLRYTVARTDVPGEWTERKNNHRQFRTASGAVLNYWKSTGTITFQGRELPAAELKAMILQRAIVIRVPVNSGQDAA